MVKFAVPMLALLTSFGIPAHAQESKSDLFAGYSFFRMSPAASSLNRVPLNGGSVSYAYHFKDWLGVVAEYLMTRFGEFGSGARTQNNFRFSAGLVLHF